VHRLRCLCAGLPGVRVFALDDLPEKWKQFTEINASYVQGGKFTPAEFANTKQHLRLNSSRVNTLRLVQ
jgi:hypothetical protein